MRRRAVLVLLVFCIACGARDERPARTTGAKTRSTETIVDGGTLRRRLEMDVVTLNALVSTSSIDRLVTQYIFTPVINFDRNLQPIPALADAWEISADGLVYRFHLNKKATFSDGKPVTGVGPHFHVTQDCRSGLGGHSDRGGVRTTGPHAHTRHRRPHGRSRLPPAVRQTAHALH